MQKTQPRPDDVGISVARLLFFGPAILWATLGALTLARSLAQRGGALGPSAAGVLLVAGGIHAALAYGVRPRAAAALRSLRTDRRGLAAWLLAGGTLALAGSITLVERADRVPVFLAGMASLWTFVFALAVRPTAGIDLSRRSTWRRSGAALGLAALALWGLEGALRLHDATAQRSLDDAYTVRTLMIEPGAATEDASFGVEASPSARSVAVLGALPGGRWRFPAVSWRQWQPPGAGLYDYALLADRPLWDSPPELLLVCVSAAEDQLQTRPPRDFWEGRSWKVWQAVALGLDRVPPRHGPIPASDDERLARELDALRACRSDPDERVETAWRENRAAARRLLAACRKQGVDVVLVVVPEPFQTDAARWQRVVRCSGGSAGEFDLRLPQHRWRTLAVDLGVPLVDLLAQGEPTPDPQQFAARRLSDWLDRRFGRAPSAPDSSVVSSK